MHNIVNKKNLILFVIATTLIFFSCVFKAHASAYLIYLYYNVNNNTLALDKERIDKVVLDRNIQPDYLDFAKNNSVGMYILKLYDVNDQEIVSTEFNKTNGAFILQIPYFSLANKLKVFEKVSEKELFQSDLSKYLTCNGNGICEFEKGENALNCIGDCANSKPVYSEQTKDKLKENNGVIKDKASGETLLSDPEFFAEKTNTTPIKTEKASSKGGFSMWILIISVLIFIIVIGFLIYKKMTNKN